MATGPSAPNAGNVFIPNWERAGRYAVGFSRNKERFRFAEYTSYVFSPKIKGFYKKFTNQENARVIDQNRYAWPYGKPRPVPVDPESFTDVAFTIKRNAYAYGLDLKTVNQADHNVKEVERQGKVQKCLTARAKRIITAITTTSNYATSTDADLSANHYNTATTLVGGKLNTGTASNPLIMNAFNAMAKAITLDTNGAVENEPGRFVIVMNPNTAIALAAAPEYKAYLSSSPDAYRQVIGNLHANSRFGLPPTLYGYDLCIETTTEVTSERDASAVARSFCFGDGYIAMLFKPMEAEGVYGEGSFGSMTVFYTNDEGNGAGKGVDLSVEEFESAQDKMWEGRVLEETAEALTCPAASWLLTSAV